MKIKALLLVFIAAVAIARSQEGKPLRVVATLPDYAFVAKAIGKERVSVSYIVEGNQDAHFIRPKPSFVSMVREADVFISTGLDLEMWAPTIVDRSGNPKIRSGAKGYVAAAYRVPLLEKPTTFSRSEGGIHIYGNPHITCSPLNMRIIAQNIAYGLIKNDMAGKSFYLNNLRDFQYQLDCKLYGPELVEILGGGTLSKLAAKNRLIPFLQAKTYRGRKLIEYLGGWLKEMLPLRGCELVTYHKNWCYFLYLFGLTELATIEPKPGIPPSPKHVAYVIDTMREHNAHIILAANYFDHEQILRVAEKAEGVAVIVPLYVGGEAEIADYFQLVDYWVAQLLKAYQGRKLK